MFSQVICRRSFPADRDINSSDEGQQHSVVLLVAANRFHLFDASTGCLLNDATERHHERRILASALSPCTHYVATSCEAKQLKLFTDLPDGQWHLLKQWDLPKRVCVLRFTNSGEQIVVADKSGDVYRCSLKDSDKELLMGHVSMITDILLTLDERYLITADKDEKIRITHYPQTFDIHGFCFGHLGYISSIACPPFAADRLISGGGDGRLLVWDYLSGTVQQSIDLKELVFRPGADEAPLDLRRIKCSSTGRVAVIFDRVNTVLLLSYDGEKQELQFDRLVGLKAAQWPIDIEFDGKTADRLWLTVDTSDCSDNALLLLLDCNNGSSKESPLIELPGSGDLQLVNREPHRFVCKDVVESTEGQFLSYFTNSELRKTCLPSLPAPAITNTVTTQTSEVFSKRIKMTDEDVV